MNRGKWVLYLGVLASGMIQYANAGSTGTIHIYGSIVEGGCNFGTGGEKVISECQRGGARVRQVNSATIGSPSFTLPLSMGNVTTRHINNDPNLAIMTVTYN